jgi:hypothetical protein
MHRTFFRQGLNRFILGSVILLKIVFFAQPLPGQESGFKIRAREHFDSVWITFGKIDRVAFYRGLGPNLNFWMEKPYFYSFGLSYSVLFINNPKEVDIPEIGEDMELTKYGFEFKYYFVPNQGGLFTRIGLSTNRLNTKGTYGYLSGSGGYFGVGWEIKFSKLGLAFEAAGRRVELEEDIRIDTYSPSLGVHFYGYI